MKLIIDIDEDYVKIINKNGASNYPEEVIKNGAPLDDLRAEINAIEISGQIDEHTLFARSADGVKNMVLEIIDRYRNEVGE